MRKLIDENQMVQLFEERGVAVSPYKKELDNIALYIRGYIKQYVQQYGYQKITFSVPQEKTNLISFIKDLEIVVNAQYSPTPCSGSGKFVPKPNQNFSYNTVSKTLLNSRIIINCYYGNDGKVWLRSVLTSLYHELNHAYDMWINVNKEKNFNRFNQSGAKSNIGYNIMQKYSVIGYCIYRLFSETEYNALVASVFGDLQGMDSQYENFQQDYKNTKAYEVYVDIKQNLWTELQALTLEEAKALFKMLKDNKISIIMKKNTLSSFRKGFFGKVNSLLSELLHDIGRTASYYYDIKAEIQRDDTTPRTLIEITDRI